MKEEKVNIGVCIINYNPVTLSSLSGGGRAYPHPPPMPLAYALMLQEERAESLALACPLKETKMFKLWLYGLRIGSLWISWYSHLEINKYSNKHDAWVCYYTSKWCPGNIVFWLAHPRNIPIHLEMLAYRVLAKAAHCMHWDWARFRVIAYAYKHGFSIAD